MKAGGVRSGGPVRVDVFLGGSPLLESKVGEGLLAFGREHPRWRFSMRAPDFRYTRGWLESQKVSGVVVLIDDKRAGKVLDAAGVPWVHLFPGRKVSRPHVEADDPAIGATGADFFLGKGFLRCAFCGIDAPWSRRRQAGFLGRLREAGREGQTHGVVFTRKPAWAITRRSEMRLRKWIAGLAKGTAIMAAHDALANRIVDLCSQEGIGVPRDLAVLGVGNHELFCLLSPVPISSIDTSVPQAAGAAAGMLAAMMRGERPDQIPPLRPRGIIERSSTEIALYGDSLVAKAVEFIRENACGEFSVGDVLREFPVSRRTLTRRFAQFVGHSPAAEIRKARLVRAERLVTESRLPLTRIAADCGYSDLSHMDRAFRREHGAPPISFRDRALE